MTFAAPKVKLFVSYASVDRDRVRSLADDLTAQAFEVWIDVDGIAAGESYGPEIADGIRSAHAVLLMSSQASLASRNVRQEIQLAWKYDRPILPVLLETLTFPDDLAYWLEGAQWIDLTALPDGEWIDRIRSTLARRGIGADLNPPRLAPTTTPADLSAQTGNLPTLDQRPIGREQELRRLVALVGNGRLVTVTGPGGVGKTTLAISAARSLMASFTGGPWFVDCAATTDGDALLDAIRSVIVIAPEPGADSMTAIEHVLGTDPTLLLLDNLEQNPAAAETVASLRTRLPKVHIVVTSRVALRISGEATFGVAPFAVPSPDQSSASELALSPAVALFVERAREARPDFVLTDGNARAVADICTRLDGLALGIELAAARSRLLPPAAIRDRLDTALALRSRSASRDDRQQTLRDTIAWSYNLLDDDQQQTLRAASVFEGGFFAAALDAVSRSTDPLDDLDALLDHHLITRDPQNVTHDEPRFRLLETIRLFATDELGEHDESTEAQRRLLAFVSSVAADARPLLEYGSDSAILHTLEADHANLRQALKTAADEDPAALCVITLSIWRFWLARGHLREGIGYLDTALTTDLASDMETTVGLLQGRAVLRETRGDLAGARDDWTTAATISIEAGDFAGAATALGGVGTASEALGDLAAASDAYKRALRMHRELENDRGVAACLHYLGSIAIMQGDLVAANDHQVEALALYRSIGDLLPLSYAIQQGGIVAFLKGDYEHAAELYQETLTLAETLSDRVGIGNAHLNLGSALEMQGDFDAATASLTAARTEFTELDDQGGVGYVDYLAGHVARNQGDLPLATDRLRVAMTTLQEVGDLPTLALVYETMAGVAVDLEDREGAAYALSEADQLRAQTGAALPASRVAEVQADRAALARLTAQTQELDGR